MRKGKLPADIQCRLCDECPISIYQLEVHCCSVRNLMLGWLLFYGINILQVGMGRHRDCEKWFGGAFWIGSSLDWWLWKWVTIIQWYWKEMLPKPSSICWHSVKVVCPDLSLLFLHQRGIYGVHLLAPFCYRERSWNWWKAQPFLLLDALRNDLFPIVWFLLSINKGRNSLFCFFKVGYRLLHQIQFR